mgnify:CR=1 FL=1
MSNVIGLVLPFFGMIFLGFVVARITRQPLEALGWRLLVLWECELGDDAQLDAKLHSFI